MFGIRTASGTAFASAALMLGGCASVEGGSAEPAQLSAMDEQEQRFARDFDAFLANSVARLDKIPAISVAVARSDGPIYVKAFGRADIERGIPATADTRFYIASSTKSFVALAMALLERKGRIDLDWTVAELAPEIAFRPELKASEVTLRHLLSHSHGLRGEPIEDRLAFTGEHDPATLWALLGRMEPNREEPLGTFNYGNVGFNVAALLVERKLGKRWQDILKEEVLEPLRLRQTLAEGVERERARGLLAHPYFSGGPSGPERISLLKVDRTMQSAGGMFSSANDLARWVALQLAAAKGVRSLTLPADVVAMTHRPISTMKLSFGPFSRTGYGLGWYSGDYRGETLFHSFGSYSGARAHVSFLPARDVGVAITTNDEGVGFRFVDTAAAYVYDWFALGPQVAKEQADEAVAKLELEAARIPQQIAADRANRAKRPWRLNLPRSAYAGRYCDPDNGTIEVALEGDRMEVARGVMRSLAEPFTQADSIRVELTPNRGEVVEFVTDGSRATALRSEGTTYQRCG
jgi:CubicO group peptidase (beta-lactamase class C family)